MSNSTTRVIEPELLQLLGLVVVKFALVEELVSQLFTLMTHGEKVALTVVTTNVSQSSITGWIRTLMDIQEPSVWHKEVRNILTDVDDLRGERNALVHGLWITQGPADSVIVRTIRLERKEVIRDEVVTAADLRDLVSRILEVAASLLKITEAAKRVT